MRRIVLDTNCLLMSLPSISPYHRVWTSILMEHITICVTNDILLEYLEIIAQKTSQTIASNIVSTIISLPNVEFITPFYKFGLIEKDPDDNKFVDCAIAAGAEYIVSNDAHFNVLKHISFPRLNVITIQEFSLIVEK